MSFRILFADDSMTAQNMGKKILTDAGYDVVAVSNGAAAVKKIAEHKPDIIILDIYMPGYSGLEVCDKVRASVDTLKTPVLLTVGKMEPYKPEDANRVRADGVIIKPFEASDLLAVIKKLEERVVPKTIAMAQDTVLLERPPDFTEFEPPEVETSAPAATTVQGTVDVPDNMATTAAFSDMLGAEPEYALDPLPVPRASSAVESDTLAEPSVKVAESPATVMDSAPSKPEEHALETWPPEPKQSPVTQSEVALDPQVEFAPSPAAFPDPVADKSQENGAGEWPQMAASASAPSFEAENANTIETAVEVGFAAPEPQLVTHHGSEVAAVAHEVQTEPEEITASTETTDQPAPTSAAEEHRFIDPGLAMDVVSFDHTAATAEPEPPAVAAQLVSETPQATAEVPKVSAEEAAHAEVRHGASGTEDDFEARVAAAMSIYDTTAEEKVELEPPVTAETHPAVIETAAEPAPAVSEEVTRSFEYVPPVSAPNQVEVDEPAFASERHFKEFSSTSGPILMTTEATQVIPVYLEPVEPKHEEHAAIPQAQSAVPEESAPVVEPTPPAVEQTVEKHVEAALPAVTEAIAAAAPAQVGADTQMITAVVDRILERLKPQMIEEISRELKGKKE